MIPTNKHAAATTSGNLETKQASVHLSPEMFDMLSSKVYQNKELAVVREIICNAKDAHVDAGNDHTIDVHLPNTLEPWFSVRDYGNGLSHEQVMNLYLSYGLSTKTDSNEVIGGLGIGSKSPLAYTTSFTVEAFHGGKRRVYSVYKDNGIPCVSKLHEEYSTEPNGLLVKVNIKGGDQYVFCNRAEEFLAFFDYNVKVTGATINQPPECIFDTEHYYTYPASNTFGRGVKAIMGGIVYRISDEFIRQLNILKIPDLVLLKFNIGDLTVAASRESLSEDKQTKEKIQAKIDEVIKQYKDEFQKKVDSTCKADVYELLRSHQLVTQKRDDNGRIIRGVVKDFNYLTYNGEHIDKLIGEFQREFRIYTRYSNSFKDKIYTVNKDTAVFLKKDVGSNFNKVISELFKTEKHYSLVLLEDGEEEFIKDLFGSDTKIRSCLAEKDRLFPKGMPSNKISVPTSGVFDKNSNEVTTLVPEQEGYYIPFNREDCLLEGFSPSKDTVTSIMRKLVDYRDNVDDKLFKGDLFIVRKGGLKAIEKTKVKKLTIGELLKMSKKVIRPKLQYILDYEKYYKCDLTVGKVRGRLQDINHDLRKNYYPVNYEVGNFSYKGYNELNLYNHFTRDLQEFILPEVKDIVDKTQDKLNEEGEHYRKNFGFLDHLHEWKLKDDDLDSIEKYIEFVKTEEANNG